MKRKLKSWQCSVKVGQYVSAAPLPCDDGGEDVEGEVLDLRGGLALLGLPHGRWVLTRTCSVTVRPKKVEKSDDLR